MQVVTNPEATARANLERNLSSSISLQQPLTTAVEKHISTAKAASTSPEATARSDLEPKPHGRVQQQTKAISSDRLDSGAHSASASTGVAAHARRRTREPRAHSQTTPATMSGAARHKSSPRKAKTKKSIISCTNNALSPKLKQNGGTMELGTPSQCFRKGFGGGDYRKIDPANLEDFLTDFSAPHRKIVHQPLFLRRRGRAAWDDQSYSVAEHAKRLRSREHAAREADPEGAGTSYG